MLSFLKKTPDKNVENGPTDTDQKGKVGFFQRLRSSLKKTHEILVTPVDELVLGRKKIDEDTFESLEEILITSDVGPQTALSLIERVQQRVKHGEFDKTSRLREYLQEEILDILSRHQGGLDISSARPFVAMIIGVNGSGKTTTIAKLANQFKAQGKKVLLAAADTFRAAGIEQLEIWGERVGCEVVKQTKGTDPSAVAFDAVHAARARSVDLLIVDTAGRLHTKVNLMEELKKIKRIMGRELPGAPHEVLLVLDATTGQNAISQAKIFKQSLGCTGLVLTKLDGSAKGGVIIGISNELKVPIRYIGIGEKMDDLQEFSAKEFVDALFE
jgi:fused signal recognition particle receptor